MIQRGVVGWGRRGEEEPATAAWHQEAEDLRPLRGQPTVHASQHGPTWLGLVGVRGCRA